MEGEKKGASFTIYFDGIDGRQGNVLAHAFVKKVTRLIITLNKMERVFINANSRQTDFEITAANKTNPTTLTLNPKPRVKDYSPLAALDWGMQQLRAVANGDEPDPRIRGEIAEEFVKLAEPVGDGYRSFWVNGFAEAVRFDSDFLSKAQVIATRRAREDAPLGWHVGVSIGSIVGELKKVDDLDDNQEFVIVPKTGPEQVTCRFPEGMRSQIGRNLFKIVRVSGKLHYGETSPFPYLIYADEIQSNPTAKRTLLEMRGVFSGKSQPKIDWDDLLNG